LLERTLCAGKGLLKYCAANFRIVAPGFKADDLRPSKADLPLYLIVHTGDDFDLALEQIALFRNRHVDARIVIVADHYRMNEVASAFHAGANGYFVDIVTCDRFIRAIELVMMGEMIFPPAFLSFMLDANRHHPVEAAASVRNGDTNGPKL
jgi:two-component system nitrate/nitrite response regulator NarL